MKAKQICFFILSLLFIGGLACGCAQAPDEVLKNKKDYGDNTQAEEASVTKCRVEALRNSSVDAITQKYNNIILPEHIDFSDIQSVNLLKLRFVSDYRNQKEKYAAAFGLDDTLDWVEDEIALKGEEGVRYDSKEKREYLAVNDNGFLVFEQKSGYTELAEESEEEEEEPDSNILDKIYIKQGGNTDVTVNLAGKKIPLSDEIDWANKKINEIMSIDGTFEYDIRTVYIRKRENEQQRLSMLAEMRYHGVPLDFFGPGVGFDSENRAGYVKQMDNSVIIEIDRDKDIARFSNNGLFEIVEEEPLEEVIDVQSAVDIVEREMSGFRKVDIAEIRVMYTLSPQYDYIGNRVYYGAPGNDVETRPVYTFMVKHGEDDSPSGVMEGNGLCYINVDMVTGEVTNNFESRGYGVQ